MELTITQDKQDLEKLETVINNNLKSFTTTGRALTEIRDRELYKLKHGGQYQTFAAYCTGEWDISLPRAYQLIDAAKVQDNLSTIVDMQISEAQARPLAKLEPDQQRAVWHRAVKSAPAGKVTAAHVNKIVKTMTGGQRNPPQKQESTRKPEAIVENAMALAGNAIYQLSRIAPDDPARDDALAKVEDWIKAQKSDWGKTLPQISGYPKTEHFESATTH